MVLSFHSSGSVFLANQRGDNLLSEHVQRFQVILSEYDDKALHTGFNERIIVCSGGRGMHGNFTRSKRITQTNRKERLPVSRQLPPEFLP